MNIYQWNKKYSEISNCYNALYHKTAVHFGFSDCQFKILYKLYIEKQPTTQNKLAGEFSISKQTVNSAVQKLVKMGLIELNKDAGAKNSKLIFLTDEGINKCENSIEPLIKAENFAIKKMDDMQLNYFLELFKLQYIIFEREIIKLLGEEK